MKYNADEKEKEVEGLRTKRDEILASINTIKIELSDIDVKKKSSEHELNELLNSISSYKKEFENIKKEFENSKDILSKKKKEIRDIENQYDSEKKKLQEEYDSMVVSHNANKIRLETNIAYLEDTIIAHRNKLDEVVKSISGKNIELSEYEVANKMVSDEIHINKATLESIKNEISNNEDILSGLIGTIHEKEDELSFVNNQIKEIIDEKDMHRITLDSLFIDKKKIEEEITIVKKDIEELLSKKNELDAKAFSLARREEALNGRESFIKDQFERAGIEYGKN